MCVFCCYSCTEGKEKEKLEAEKLRVAVHLLPEESFIEKMEEAALLPESQEPPPPPPAPATKGWWNFMHALHLETELML